MTAATGRYAPLPDELTSAHIDDIHALLDAEWWSTGRSRADVEACIASSLCVGHVDTETGHVVSFLRVVTDYRFFACILDVVVHPDTRGTGLGARLMDDTFSHPRLQQLRGIGLQCEDALVPFYARWGFTDAVGRSKQMKRVFDRDAGETPAAVASARAAARPAGA